MPETETRSDESAAQADEQQIHLTFDPPLYTQRYSYVYDKLMKANPPVVQMADLGCAEGKFVDRVKQLPFLSELLAADMDPDALSECVYQAQPRAWNYIFPRFLPLTVRVLRANILLPDPSFRNLDAITCIELIEHLPVASLPDFVTTVFGFFNPRILIITTPNSEFNVFFPQLKGGKMRHWDHRFEWTRRQFEDWCTAAASSYSYSVTFDGVGNPPVGSPDVGHCSQIAVFHRLETQPEPTDPIPVLCQELNVFKFPGREKGDPESEPQPFDWSFLQKED